MSNEKDLAQNKSAEFGAGSDLEERIIRAALKLAAMQGWNETELNDIAREANIRLVDLLSVARSRDDILRCYFQQVDAKMLDNVGEPDTSLPLKDRLFDLIMERLELMNEDREGVRSILLTIPFSGPFSAFAHAVRFHESVKLIMSGAGMRAHGATAFFKKKALALICLLSLRLWLKDDSPDLSQTMAGLDKMLRRTQTLAGTLGFDRSMDNVIK